ncbi:synaptotagmin 18, partial [Lottia gigantea]
GISDKRYVLLNNQEVEIEGYKALDIISRKSQIACTSTAPDAFGKSDIYADSKPPSYPRPIIGIIHGAKLSEARSFEDISFDPRSEPIKRCTSLTTLYKDVPETNNTDSLTFMTLFINLDTDHNCLTISLDKLYNVLKIDLYNDIHIWLRVFPDHPEGFHSQPVHAAKNLEFIDIFRLKDQTVENLIKSTFRLTVLGKDSKKKSHRESIICEGFVNGRDIDWKSAQNNEIKVYFKRKWMKKMSTSNKFLESDLGELFVLLQYQSMAKRMKVLIRKANNLPKSDKLIGVPGHSVVINLYKDGEIVSSRETQVQGGLHPVWNQPFLFTIPNEHHDSYNLEFIIKRNRRYTKDNIIGHVLVGPGAPKSGGDQWQEAMKPRGLECALWHNITPIFTYRN